MLLTELQTLLTSFYDVALADDVNDFLVTDAELLDRLTRGAHGRDIDEKLILIEEQEALDLALYIDRAVLDRLAGGNPCRSLNRSNLADFLTALEGVSHFSYVAWSAAQDRPVTLLELEVQAEVDKYVTTRRLVTRQGADSLGAPILSCLFEQPVLAAGLSSDEQRRYRDAAHLAALYCASLEARFPAGEPVPDMVRELRDFYRMPQGRKVSRIRALQFS
jgi:hypothetical protein